MLPLLLLLSVRGSEARCDPCASGFQFREYPEFPLGNAFVNCGDLWDYISSPEANSFPESCGGKANYPYMCWESCEKFHEEMMITGCCQLQPADKCWIQKGMFSRTNIMTDKGVQKLSSLIAASGCTEVMADSLSISNSVTSFKGLEALVHVSKLEIFHLKQMTNLEGLDNIRTVGELSVYENHELTSLRGLSGLIFACTLHVIDNSVLPSMEGVDGLQSLGGCFENEPLPVPFNMSTQILAHATIPSIESKLGLKLNGNKAMTSLQGLRALQKVVGVLEIENNLELISLDGLEALVDVVSTDDGEIRYDSGLGISKNPRLTSLQGLQSLKKVEFNLIIEKNNMLTSIEPLDRLTNYDEMLVVYISDNALLCMSSEQRRVCQGEQTLVQNCRCRPGFFPDDNNCNSCPAGSFCTGGEAEPHLCLPGSESTVGDTLCTCAEGFEPNGTSPDPATKTWNCKKCADFATSAGNNKYCFCDSTTHGVEDFYQDGSVCNCRRQNFMSRSAQRCQDCSEGEECDWDFARARSGDTVRPPSIKPGYWAEMVADTSNFSRHSVWRCHSSETCLGNSMCAAHRAGTACGDCFPGFHGGPDGPCSQCEFPPDTHRALLACTMVGLMLVTMFWLQVTARLGQKFTMAKTKDVKNVWRLIKQVIKYLQLLGVVYTFHIEWPISLRSLFEFLGQFSLPIDGVLAEQCLAFDHSVGLQVYYRCILPALVLCMCMASVPLAYAGSRVMRWAPCSQLQHLAPRARVMVSDASQFAFQIFSIFFISILKSITSLFRCRDNPNGIWVVQEFPQFECFADRWMGLVPVLVAAIVCYVMCHVIGLVLIVKRCLQSLQATNGRSRGPFGFIVEDFRTAQIIFPVVIVIKDIAINLISLVPVYPGLQLVCALGVLAFYSLVVLTESPFEESLSNKLEVHLHASLMLQVAVLESDASSEEMSTIFTVLLIVSLAVAVAMVILQVLLVIPSLAKHVPQLFKPLSQRDFNQHVRQVFADVDNDIVAVQSVVCETRGEILRPRRSGICQILTTPHLSSKSLSKAESGTVTVSTPTERKDTTESAQSDSAPLKVTDSSKNDEGESAQSDGAPIKIDPNKIPTTWAQVMNDKNAYSDDMSYSDDETEESPMAEAVIKVSI